MHALIFDIAHLLAGSLVVMSFVQLYQDRLSALINVFAAHALLLALSVAWQAFAQDAPHLYITAAIALLTVLHLGVLAFQPELQKDSIVYRGLNTAVLAPTPRPSVATTRNVNPGFRAIVRSA